MRVENIRLETAMKEVSGIPVIKATGEIDVYTVPEFKSSINKVIDSGAKDLIIDLTDIDYMDSGGFGVLLGATKRIRLKNGVILLAGCSDAIERMLKITRLDTIFGMFPNIDDAVMNIISRNQ
ncbi:MAG: STAS domain-containing protein [Armatimonadota bacterium]